MTKERFWIQVFQEGKGINVGSIEGYPSLKEAWCTFKELSKYYRDHHYEIISNENKVVNSGVIQ